MSESDETAQISKANCSRQQDEEAMNANRATMKKEELARLERGLGVNRAANEVKEA